MVPFALIAAERLLGGHVRSQVHSCLIMRLPPGHQNLPGIHEARVRDAARVGAQARRRQLHATFKDNQPKLVDRSVAAARPDNSLNRRPAYRIDPHYIDAGPGQGSDGTSRKASVVLTASPRRQTMDKDAKVCLVLRYMVQAQAQGRKRCSSLRNEQMS